MTIEIDENDLHAYLDGQLAPEQEAVVLAWLETDPEARQRLHDYAEQKLLTAIGVSEDVGEADPERTEELAEELGARLQQALTKRRPFVWLRQAAAIVALVAAGWTTNELVHRFIPEQLPTYVVEATGAHLVFAEGPMPPAVNPDQGGGELARWMSARLGEQVEVPELTPIGLKLVGGRVMGDTQHPLAGLIYEDRECHRLTICLTPREDGKVDGLHMAQVGGVRVGYWSNGDQSYVIVADTSETQLAAIINQLTHNGERASVRHY
jgi:anti-sigma factor RsiW